MKISTEQMLNSQAGEFLACSLGQTPHISQMVETAPPWSIGSTEARPAKCVTKSLNLGQGLSLDSKEAQARQRLWPPGSKGLLQTGAESCTVVESPDLKPRSPGVKGSRLVRTKGCWPAPKPGSGMAAALGLHGDPAGTALYLGDRSL